MRSKNTKTMWLCGWKLGWLVVGVLLMAGAEGQAQEEPEQLSKLDRLPTWHPARPSANGRSRVKSASPEATTYTDLDDLVQQHANGRRVESLVLTGQVIGPNAHKLSPLLRDIRALTLQYLTTGQADSLLGQVRDWSRLERMTVDIAYPGPDRANPNRLVSLPTALRRFRNLRDLRIQEDGLNWMESMPVLAGMKALRRLEIDRWQSQPKGNKQPVLTTLRPLTALRLRGNGWLIMPETVNGLSHLKELDLQSLPITTETLQDMLNQLPALETFRMTKCWQVQTLRFDKLRRLKTVELAYNDKFSVDAALLAGMPHVQRLTIKGGLPIDLTELGNLTRLQYLNIMGNRQSARLPESVHTLSQLTDLRIYDVKLGSLPRSFGLLPRLQTLHLNYCSLDSLPATFGQLKALRDLKMYSNKLKHLPELKHLRNLRLLNISGAQLTTLPDDIGQLTKLTTLNISENQLTELPASVTRLVNLKQLSAEHNRLKRLPDDLGKLSNLTGLSLHMNQLTGLPASLGLLRNLTSISADYNRLESLPDELGNLRKLRGLSLDNNQLTSLPNSLGQLDSLQSLRIGQNRLRVLPAGFSQLRSLTDVSIDANELTSLPADLGNLQKLTHLYLNKLPITELPASVSALVNLNSLIITDTQLRALPHNIGALTNLQYVRLTNNRLTTLPNSVGQWQAVTTLDLTGNPLERLPNGIGRMTNLTELIIAGKTSASAGAVGTLRQLPDSIIDCDRLQTLTIENQPQLDADDVFSKAVRMKNLSELSVVNCNVAQLPNVAWKTVSWQKLNVAKNQLTELPFGLLDAPKLKSISARENRLPNALNRDYLNKQTLLSGFAEAGKLPLAMTAKPNGRTTEVLLQLANEKASADDWQGAVNALGKAIDYAPDSMRATPYAERSSFYYARQQYANALADLDSAIVYTPKLNYGGLNNPGSIRAILTAHWKWKGYIYANMGQYNDALASLAQAERLLPADPFPKYAQDVGSNEVDRGLYLTLQGNLPAAELSYRRAIDAYQKAERAHVGIRLKVVELCLLTGQYDRAQQLLTTLSNEQLKGGYETLNEYLNHCLAILTGNETGDQALTEFKAYCDQHSQELSWRFTLTDTWLAHKKVESLKISAFRQLQSVAQSRLIQPR